MKLYTFSLAQNGQRVTAEVFEGGIERWLKNDKN